MNLGVCACYCFLSGAKRTLPRGFLAPVLLILLPSFFKLFWRLNPLLPCRTTGGRLDATSGGGRVSRSTGFSKRGLAFLNEWNWIMSFSILEYRHAYSYKRVCRYDAFWAAKHRNSSNSHKLYLSRDGIGLIWAITFISKEEGLKTK